MALRRRNVAEEIVGVGRARKRLERARQLGAIDTIAADLPEAMDSADAFVSCLPPRMIRKRWGEIAQLSRPGLFVTDVGSVKEAIVSEAENQLPPGTLFIGSHPMAGSEKSGVESARGDLFEGACCFVTPTEKTDPQALNLGVQFWRAIGSRVVVIDPRRHDDLLASISHLPHLLAVTLMQNLCAAGDATLFHRAVIAGGFRDTTRIAAGKPEVWEQIFTENAPALLGNLDRAIALLQEWRELISQSDSTGEIMERLAQAGLQRTELSPETDSSPV